MFTQVCKYALVSFCPHELFPNTKFDMGPCEYRHDELFKKQFILLNDQDRNPYEKKYIDETIGSSAQSNSSRVPKADRPNRRQDQESHGQDRKPDQ